MKLWRAATSIALLALQSALAEDTEYVLSLKGADAFDAAVKASNFFVGEFFAPWCGHCKSLAPEYEKAAKQLNESGTDVVLAQIDATLDENKDLATKYGIRGFPTLKVFRGGDTESPTDYNGPRDADGVVAHLAKLAGPASKELTKASEVADLSKEDIAVLGVFAAKDSMEYLAYEAAAEQLREDFTFAHTFDKSLSKEVSALPGIAVYKSFDQHLTLHEGSFTTKAILEFIEAASTPELVEMDQSPRNKRSMSRIFGDAEKPKLLAIVPKSHSLLKKLRAELTTASKDRADDISILFVDPETSAQVAKFFSIEDSELPAYAIHEQASNSKYIAKDVKAGFLAKWLDKYKAGKLEKYIKSEEAPKKNDGPVKIVTANTFDELVFSGKNVLLEFYAPWCGHCKSLEPIYEQVGQHFAKDTTVVIAKMDATSNDVASPKFSVQGFPTLFWIAADGSIEQFSGGRTLEELTGFVEGKLKGEEALDQKDLDSETDHEEL